MDHLSFNKKGGEEIILNEYRNDHGLFFFFKKKKKKRNQQKWVTESNTDVKDLSFTLLSGSQSLKRSNLPEINGLKFHTFLNITQQQQLSLLWWTPLLPLTCMNGGGGGGGGGEAC